MKNIVLSFLGFTLLIVTILAADYFIGYKWFSFLEPKKENVRREIFLNTRSYDEGKLQDLIKIRMEYLQADKETKPIIASTIRHMFSEYNESKLPLELKFFLKKIKYGEYE